MAESLTKLVHSGKVQIQIYQEIKMISIFSLLNTKIESGYNSALKCTQALFTNDREALATMTKDEIENTFKAASLTTLTLEPGKLFKVEVSLIFCTK